MARASREYLAGRYVAQEARRAGKARADDHTYAIGRVVDTDPPGRAPPAAAGTIEARAAGPYPVVPLCRAMRLPEPVPEYQFHPQRKWRADYGWPLHMLLLEVEGGIWTQGRHTRGAGALADLEKYSEAAILGWRVIYCTPDDLLTAGIDRVRRALAMTRRVA